MEQRARTSDDDLRDKVRDGYAARAQGDASACGCCAGDNDEAARKMGYSEVDVSAVPEGANLGLGCGAPLEFAGVGPGDVVLDLGSGAGFDAFLAAREVGPEGRVIGVDMTPEMITKARDNAAAGGYGNVEFRQGLIEELPLEDASIDAVISNCVINLSPDKRAVFRDAFRVLRPGGRLAVSDIVLRDPLPESVAGSLAAYVGCIAGAALRDDYVEMIRAAGFERIEVARERPAIDVLSLDDPVVVGVLEGLGLAGLEMASEEALGLARGILSAQIVASKPVLDRRGPAGEPT